MMGEREFSVTRRRVKAKGAGGRSGEAGRICGRAGKEKLVYFRSK